MLAEAATMGLSYPIHGGYDSCHRGTSTLSSSELFGGTNGRTRFGLDATRFGLDATSGEIVSMPGCLALRTGSLASSRAVSG
eukprot:665799-Pelagomonas_calceolata.AAC.1